MGFYKCVFKVLTLEGCVCVLNGEWHCVDGAWSVPSFPFVEFWSIGSLYRTLMVQRVLKCIHEQLNDHIDEREICIYSLETMARNQPSISIQVWHDCCGMRDQERMISYSGLRGLL